jgi:hypothetical protein
LHIGLSAPQIHVKQAPECPVCASAARTFVAECYDFELQTSANAWRYWRCDRCSAIWLDPRPADDALGVIYPSTYYAYAGGSSRVSSLLQWGRRELAKRKLRSIMYGSGVPLSYLDIGCADGAYMREMERLGMDPSRINGFDISQESIDHLGRDGFRASVSRIEDFDGVPPASVDLITMFNVIEHVADPRLAVRRIATSRRSLPMPCGVRPCCGEAVADGPG